jgi:hypothetical protein
LRSPITFLQKFSYLAGEHHALPKGSVTDESRAEQRHSLNASAKPTEKGDGGNSQLSRNADRNSSIRKTSAI